MIWGKTCQEIQQIKDRGVPWHYWFAWYPVSFTDGRLVWLQTILREKRYYHARDGGFWSANYKESIG